MSKVIYKPSGPAAEYASYAANFYNGCSNLCVYCFNRTGITASMLGGDVPTLKKSLVNPTKAFEFFKKDLFYWKSEILSSGQSLHFNFVSDPCLRETLELNWKCITYALNESIPVQVLTKRTDWLTAEIVQEALANPLLMVGFTLTGHDELEPNASSTMERINAIKTLHDAGVRTWLSLEPIIAPDATWRMISETLGSVDHYKIGILSGKKTYTPVEIREFKERVDALKLESVYWKKSLLEFIQK